MAFNTATLPGAKGTYLLVLQLDEARRLAIGRLGAFDFTAGRYVYVGSAFGPGGLRGRLARHLAPPTVRHWHIDYLRAAAPVIDVAWHSGDRDCEHRWAASLAATPGATIPVPRFGASDCACPAHLFHLDETVALAALMRDLGAARVRR